MGALVWKAQVNGQVYDADFETLKQWVAQGSVGPTDQVYKEGLGWSEARNIPVLRDLFAPPSPPPSFGGPAYPSSGYNQPYGGTPSPGPVSYPPLPAAGYSSGAYGGYGGGAYGASGYTPHAPAYGQVGFVPPAYGYGASLPSLATLGQRFFAYFIDCLGSLGFCVPSIIYLIATFEPTGDPRNPIPPASILGFYLLLFLGAFGYLALMIWMMSRNGTTPGKKAAGIVVLDDQGRYPTIGKAIGREVLKGILGQACGLLLLWLLFDDRHQQLYDKVMGMNVYEG
jgi:uncharacterized RDD family membrane protein YckC